MHARQLPKVRWNRLTQPRSSLRYLNLVRLGFSYTKTTNYIHHQLRTYPTAPSPTMASYPPERTPEEAISLFKAVEEKFPSESLGDDRWYLILVSSLSLSLAGLIPPKTHLQRGAAFFLVKLDHIHSLRNI